MYENEFSPNGYLPLWSHSPPRIRFGPTPDSQYDSSRYFFAPQDALPSTLNGLRSRACKVSRVAALFLEPGSRPHRDHTRVAPNYRDIFLSGNRFEAAPNGPYSASQEPPGGGVTSAGAPDDVAPAGAAFGA